MTLRVGSPEARATVQVFAGDPVVTLAALRPRDNLAAACAVVEQLLLARPTADIAFVARDREHRSQLTRRLKHRFDRMSSNITAFQSTNIPSTFFLRDGKWSHVVVTEGELMRHAPDLVVADFTDHQFPLSYAPIDQALLVGPAPTSVIDEATQDAELLSSVLDRQRTWGPVPVEVILAGTPG